MIPANTLRAVERLKGRGFHNRDVAALTGVDVREIRRHYARVSRRQYKRRQALKGLS